MEGIFLFGLFFLLLFLGVPILTSAGIPALLFVWHYNLGLDMVSANFYSNIAKFPLLAIPFFILTGFLMDRVGLSRRLVNLLALLVGPVPGGLAIVAILSCVFFGAVSGTGPADTAAIGAVMIPAMVKRGYDKGFSSALVAAAATTDVLIPPSLAFVLYGVITETSISGLFAAGVLPGLLMGLVMIPPELGAQMPLICATQPGLESGGYWHNAHGRMRLAANDPARDAASAARLFDACEELVARRD